MDNKTIIKPLTNKLFDEAVNLVLKAGLDTKQEIEHHLQHIDAHYVALDHKKIVGLIGWYQDNVNYANDAMGDKFPGEKAYWVGFFTVDKDYQNQGIGSELLNRLESVVKDKGADELWVSSVPETKSYYEEHGFKLVLNGSINGNQKFFCVKRLNNNYLQVGVNVFVARNNRLLLGQRKNIYGDGDWGLPGGHLEIGEAMIAAARRELFEETGLVAKSFEFVNLVNDPQPNGHYLQVGFLAKDAKGESELKELERCHQWQWFSLDNLPKNIFLSHQKQIASFLNQGSSFIDSK